MAPIQAQSGHGERGERLTNTPFSAKDGGRHRQERALVLTSLRCTIRRRALATLSYDNMVPGVPDFGPGTYHIVVASSSSAATQYLTT